MYVPPSSPTAARYSRKRRFSRQKRKHASRNPKNAIGSSLPEATRVPDSRSTDSAGESGGARSRPHEPSCTAQPPGCVPGGGGALAPPAGGWDRRSDRTYRETVSLVAVAFVVLAQAGLTGTRDIARPAPSSEHFMQDAASGGQAEVSLGRMAANKAASPEVRRFAERMVKDHGAAGDQLKELAQRRGVSLSTRLDPADRELIDRLGKLSGPEFDREYMRAMVDDHEKDVAKFEREVKAGRDADVKAFAERTLPTLRQHLELA